MLLNQLFESLETVKPYKGWTYTNYDEDYGDFLMKKEHRASKDGKEVEIDWTPYATMTDAQFKAWIDLGMPTRKTIGSIGPLDGDDLDQMMKTKAGTKAMLSREDRMHEQKCSCCGNEIVNGKCGCGPECPHCGGKHDLDEISKATKGSYAQKAMTDIFAKGADVGTAVARGDSAEADRAARKAQKRQRTLQKILHKGVYQPQD